MVEADIHDWRNAVGTGPFILKDYVEGSSLTYVRNPLYWGTTTIDGKEYKLPFVDRLVWPIVPDESTRIATLRTGKCDIMESVGWRYKETLQETCPELRVYRTLSTTFTCISPRLDIEEPPFSDIRIRKAMSMAIDRQAIIDSQMGGEAELVSAPFSAGWSEDLYTPLEELPDSAKELYEYNPEKAKQLLAEAGYPDGFKAEMVILNLGTAPDLAAMIADYWSEIGIDVELKPYEYGAYLALMFSKRFKHIYLRYKGNGDPFVLSWIAGDPSYRGNSAMYDDPYFRERLEALDQEPDAAKAKQALKELNVYLIEQCPYIFLPVGYNYAYAWPWAKNWYGELNANARSPGQIHARVWIDRDLKYKMIGQR